MSEASGKAFTFERQQTGIYRVRDGKGNCIGTITGHAGHWSPEKKSGTHSPVHRTRADAALALASSRSKST
jgi:hypothetical protein